ncbi:MAG: hypothetical protein A3D87_03620 [Omnitrophica WOR_2 bacterium RIFCSPHIGHO2_02_FULL_50_17]|nr:MAG: hypothetical protein A3D87_03620 [Omnitrophica WOR_2 bacterium RIFCSPHIGHO2_02_FULL_50_17]
MNTIRGSALFGKRVLSSIILLAVCATPLWATEIAVIVHKDNPLEDISFDNLRKICRAEKQFWDGGEKIYLLLRESGNQEKTIMLKTVYQMEEMGLKKFWLTKLFREEIPSFPNALGSNEAVKRFVAQVPNAIGFIDGQYVDDTVKVLTIDGKSFQSPGYPLTDQSQ